MKILTEKKLHELEDIILIFDRCNQHLKKVEDKYSLKKKNAVDRLSFIKPAKIRGASEFKKVNFNNNTDENVSEQLSSHSSIFITSHNSSLGRKGDSSPSEWGFEQAINSSNENLNQ